MSIRDFDPLLKKAAERAKAKAHTAQPPSSEGATIRRAASPIRMQVGARNIKVTEQGSAAALVRAMNAAFAEIAKDFKAFTSQLEGFLAEDMGAALEPTFDKSQQLVPVKSGDLKKSGFLEIESFRGGARAVIGYGKDSFPPYAVFVHEIPYHHEDPWTDKFLQRPVEEDYFNILQRVADRVQIRIGGV